jgi:hypothetical protein
LCPLRILLADLCFWSENESKDCPRMGFGVRHVFSCVSLVRQFLIVPWLEAHCGHSVEA